MPTIKQHGVTLALPVEHEAAQVRKVLSGYLKNVGRLAVAVEHRYPGRGFVDVGVNAVGSAAVVRAHSNLPILCIECIEGSERDLELLQKSVSNPGADIEVARTPATFERLDSILARHPRFQSAKILRLNTDGMDGRIILGALDWIAAAQPVLFWNHDPGKDGAGGGHSLDIFRHLFDIGYRTAIVFDHRGDYVQTLSLDARQQLADLSDYLPGGEGRYGHCAICAFHEDDLDLRTQVRRLELENRRVRTQNSALPPEEPLFRALMEGQFAVHRTEVSQEAQDAITGAMDRLTAALTAEEARRRTVEAAEMPRSMDANEMHYALLQRRESELSESLANKTVELQAVRAHVEVERYRLQVQVQDQEKRISAKEAEIQKLHGLLRELIADRSARMPVDSEAATSSAVLIQREAEISDLKARLAQAKNECARLQSDLTESLSECGKLKHDMKNSLALRAARSLRWILEPIRRLFDASSPPSGGRG